jgi:hypothetical protein
MADTFTTKLGLIMPDPASNYNVETQFNMNMALIDQHLGCLAADYTANVTAAQLITLASTLPKNLGGHVVHLTVVEDITLLAGLLFDGHYNGTFVLEVASTKTILSDFYIIFQNMHAGMKFINLSAASTVASGAFYVSLANCREVFVETRFKVSNVNATLPVFKLSGGTVLHDTAYLGAVTHAPFDIWAADATVGALTISSFARANITSLYLNTTAGTAHPKIVCDNGGVLIKPLSSLDESGGTGYDYTGYLPVEEIGLYYGGQVITPYRAMKPEGYFLDGTTNWTLQIPADDATVWDINNIGDDSELATAKVVAVRDGMLFVEILSGALPNDATEYGIAPTGTNDYRAFGTCSDAQTDRTVIVNEI